MTEYLVIITPQKPGFSPERIPVTASDEDEATFKALEFYKGIPHRPTEGGFWVRVTKPDTE